jgi:DNA-binding NtrC family response regulator
MTTTKKFADVVESFEALTIKKQMKIIAARAALSKLFYKEVMEEFERTLLQAFLDKHRFNVLKMSTEIKLHRNSISKKMKKLKIREKAGKTADKA